MFSFIVEAYNFLFYNPIFEALVFIYQNLSFSSLGFSILILTVGIRIILFPLFYKSAKSQAIMKKIRPKIKAIKEEYKDNKEKQAEKLMELYKKYGFNPFSSFLVLLIQLPVFIALFRIFRNSDLLTETFSNLTFLGVINLTSSSIILALGVAVIQYFQSKVSLSNDDSSNNSDSSPMAGFQSKLKYILPPISFMVLVNLPSALALYWGTSTIFSLGQQVYIKKKIDQMDFSAEEEIEIKEDQNKENNSEHKKENKSDN
ncbi:MAG: YidC/Oxa1 family membrane protein insertase [Candidatus Magasanikbacteria bacterium]